MRRTITSVADRTAASRAAHQAGSSPVLRFSTYRPFAGRHRDRVVLRLVAVADDAVLFALVVDRLFLAGDEQFVAGLELVPPSS
jgi:hypothetical protein